MMKKCSEGSLRTKVARALFAYRTTPQTTTGLSPAEMLMGRKLRCSLDLIHPDLKKREQDKQGKLKENHDRRARGRHFGEEDPVLTRNFGPGPRWIPGHVETATGPVSYKVRLADGRVVRRHVDQIHSRACYPVENPEVEVGGYTSPSSDAAPSSGPTTPELVTPSEQEETDGACS